MFSKHSKKVLFSCDLDNSATIALAQGLSITCSPFTESEIWKVSGDKSRENQGQKFGENPRIHSRKDSPK